MQYGAVISGRFLSRPIAYCAGGDRGRDSDCACEEYRALPGAAGPRRHGLFGAEHVSGRKTAYDLIAVEKGNVLINMDAQAPNKVFGEWAGNGGFLPKATALHAEYRYGASRLDFCLETPGGLHLVEVKGVTLEEQGAARFPDAPTERGIKHIQELQGAVKRGLDATLFFVVQLQNVRSVAPNDATHPAFGRALREAACHGVNVCAYDCVVTPDSISINRPVPVIL